MSTWRRKAVALCPQLKQDFQMGDRSPYTAFNALLSLLWDSIEKSDDEKVKQIFHFAKWCSQQKAESLSNAAGVSFYEHLFDEWQHHHAIAKWLTPAVIKNYIGLWEHRLSNDQFDELKKILPQLK